MRAFLGISGYDYPRWGGVFYPDDVPRRRWLEYASRQFNSVELNGTFYGFDAERVDRFMAMLPRTSSAAETVAREHDHRLRRGALVNAAVNVRYRYAFDVRHPSNFREGFYAILRKHRCAVFDNDAKVHAPCDALRLRERLHREAPIGV